MPAPLTPAECDLQDFPFMPLHVARLRDSDLAAEECAEACWYAVLLWAASWHQLPAGSLPDNDAVLARLIGLGKDVRTFRKHRAAALRNFVLCDDGRLYHPVVAEQAVIAWQSKLQQRWRTECARIKKQNQRHGQDDPSPSFEEYLASLNVPDPRPQSVPRDRAESPPGQSIQGTGTGTGKQEEDADASFVGGKPPTARGEVRKAFDAWNELAGRLGLPIAKTLDEGRRRVIAKRLEDGGLVAWGEALLAIERSQHCRGENDRSWKADLDFVCQLKSWRRLREGFYGGAPAAETGPAAAWSGPADVLAAVAAALGDEQGRGYLTAYCAWRDVPERALVCSHEVIAKKIRDAAGGRLSAMGVTLLVEAGRAA